MAFFLLGEFKYNLSKLLTWHITKRRYIRNITNKKQANYEKSIDDPRSVYSVCH